jgi:lipopolysaccharide transport system permease protein
MLRPIWDYRGFVVGSVKREFQSKYRNSLLGAAWTILNPLAMIVVYTVIFAQVMKARLPGQDGTFAYSVYLCAGALTWGLFAELVSRAQTVFLDNSALLKKLSFPRLCLPIVVVANATLNFVIIFTLFITFLVIIGNFPGIPFLAVFPLLALLICLAIGLGMTLAVLNVFFRDVGQFFGVFLTFWFWLTPIVYPINILPTELQNIVSWNPLTPLVTAFQTILGQGLWPEWHTLWFVAVLALLLNFIGLRLFRKHAGEMVDEL